ncbi:hypothetical protein [Burkholderia sp. BCC0322]|nr:hypothetical protein [Burkholderia sp. BCC0322]
MKIALDRHMIRHLPLDRLPHVVAALGNDRIRARWRSPFRSHGGALTP